MIGIGIITLVGSGEESGNPANDYKVRMSISDERHEVICFPISVMGTSGKRGGFMPTYSLNDSVLVLLANKQYGFIIGSLDSTGQGPLAGETVMMEEGGAKIHLGDGHGFDAAVEGRGSATIVAQRIAMAVGDIEDWAHDVNQEFIDSSLQEKEVSYPYEPTFPKEGFYVETDNGDHFHMASGTIEIQSSEGATTKISINADGSIDLVSAGAINIDTGGNVVFQGGSKSVAADGDIINVNNGILAGGAWTATITAGQITMSPIGAPIPVVPPSNLVGSAINIIDADITGATLDSPNRKEKVE
jgi:hypothetical protein